MTPPLRRIATTGVLLVAVVALGAFARLPTPSTARLEIDPTAPTERPSDLRRAPPQSIVRLLDPETLENVPGHFLPVEEGGWAISSADGRLLALVGGEQTQVVNAQTLGVIATVDGAEDVLRFAPEGDALFFQRWYGDVISLGRQPLEPGAAPVEVGLPPDAQVHEAVPLREGRTAAFVFADLPRVVVADLITGTIAADVPLPGVQAEYPYLTTAPQSGQIPVLPQALPGLGWDVERERLYVVHPDHDRVTVVDLAAGEVIAEADVRRAFSLGDLLFARPAHAGGPYREGTAKSAQVSPDGTRLYVTGSHTDVEESGEWYREVVTPLGLQLIDTGDLTEVARVDVPTEALQLSPGGRWLALSGRDPGTRVLDAATLEEIGHLGADQEGWAVFGNRADVIRVESWEQGRGRVQTFSLPGLELLGERDLREEGYIDLANGLLYETV